jgi:hypothetical protein
MPNQRAKNKVYIGGFVDKRLHGAIMKLAKQEGMDSNRFGFAARLMEESLERRTGKKLGTTAPKESKK